MKTANTTLLSCCLLFVMTVALSQAFPIIPLWVSSTPTRLLLEHAFLRRGSVRRSSSTATPPLGAKSSLGDDNSAGPRKKIAIVGGGLAGLSTCFHLLSKTSCDITIFDVSDKSGGASAVAGGLLHPLSPRGKLVHWGMQGLDATNQLIKLACEYNSTVLVRDQLYRLAVTDAQRQQLQATAQALPLLCEWLDDASDIANATSSSGNERDEHDDSSAPDKILGALRLSNGCCVIHVPSYLDGLYEACQDLASKTESTLAWQTTTKPITEQPSALPPHDDESFDATVYCAGAGMFDKGRSDTSLLQQSLFPIQLVRGQSLELSFQGSPVVQQAQQQPQLALLCGKYVAPMPDAGRVLVGATHEFKETKLSTDQVVAELSARTFGFVDWDSVVVNKVTSGVRVQSERSMYGRRPIVGRLSTTTEDNDNNTTRSSSWVFTGLSSRGLLYHALYGDILANAILQDSEERLLDHCQGILWWKKN